MLGEFTGKSQGIFQIQPAAHCLEHLVVGQLLHILEHGQQRRADVRLEGSLPLQVLSEPSSVQQFFQAIPQP